VALDPQTGLASVVGAGHPPLLIARHDGGTESIPSSAPPLGLVEKSEFVATDVELRPGDAFFLYTDGLYGPEQGESPRLTPAKLAEMLQPIPATSHDFLARVIQEATRGDSDKPLPDDLAAIAVKRSI
jgi:sigma-B regulation protein RsbU (phosphoserine phosphatase)